MDPEGVREVFYAECVSALDNGFRTVMRSMPFPVRFKESYSKGLHLPLARPLPKRLDITLQQSTGLHAYDAIALADIDPVVFDADDLLNLLAYVEAGGGLLMMAGPNSFSKAVRNWGPLREALPASFNVRPARRVRMWHELAAAVPAPEPVPIRLRDQHPVTRGLSGELGSARALDPLDARPSAVVLAAAGRKPIVVADTYGLGRVVMVGASPGPEPDGMFRTPGWADLLRQALMWLMKRDGDLVIESCDLNASAMPAGEQRTLSITIDREAPRPIKGQALIRRADPGWLSAGREPQWGPAEEQPVETEAKRVSATFSPSLPGRWQIEMQAYGDDWANVRIAEIEASSPLGLRIWPRYGTYVTAPGRVFSVKLAADRPVEAALRIVDFDEEEVWEGDGAAPGPVDLTIPNLELGDYELVALAEGEEARLRFCVTEQLKSLSFSLGGYGGGDTEERVRWWYDYYHSRGFDTFATSLPDAMNDAAPPSDFDPLAFQHYLVQRDGCNLWGEYLGAAILSTHGSRGDEGSKPTTPCILGPQYSTKLRELLEPKFRGAASLPRMTSLEILDEPHLYRANVCRCQRCQDKFRERYRYEFPTWDQAIAAKDGRTRDYFEWIIDYATRAFRQGFEIWKSLREAEGGKLSTLHHVFCALGSGHHSADNSVAQDLPWSPHADFIEFDCYNYMYPHWRANYKLRWNEFHYMMGHFRFLALRNRQRIGFFIQVTDRDVPVNDWDPLRAPSETLYTAVGSGAKHFHLMAHGGFTNTQNCREEKFDAFAQDVRKVQSVAPLLERARSPRSRIAMTFNFHDRLYRLPEHYLPEGYIGLGFYGREQRPFDTTWPYHKAPVNVAEMLFRAFGETDVIDQSAFRDGALEDYGGFALTGTDYIDDADAEAVRRFVERGGALICDHIPTRNLEGQPSDILTPLFSGEAEHFYRDVTVSYSDFGQGKALLFSSDLNELYTSSVEQDDMVTRHAIKDLVREFFFSAGLRPHARSSNYEIEGNVLLTPDTIVLVVVNHAEDRQQSEITVFSPPVPVAHAYDLVTMQKFPFQTTPEGIVLEVDLDEREGLILGLYPAVPSTLSVEPDTPRYSRGDRLAFSVELTDDSGAKVRGDHLVEVCVTDARGDERRQFGGLRCAHNGALRVDEPLAMNARVGTWTISAFDRFTTRQVRTQVTVE